MPIALQKFDDQRASIQKTNANPRLGFPASPWINNNQTMFPFSGEGEVASVFRLAGQRIAPPFDLVASVGSQRNAPRRRHVRIDYVNASGQWRSNPQFLTAGGEDRA